MAVSIPGVSNLRKFCGDAVRLPSAMPPGDILLIAKRGLYHERYKPLSHVWETVLFLKFRQIHAKEDEDNTGQEPGQKKGREQEDRFVIFVVVLLAGEQFVRIIDIIEIQPQGRQCWMLKTGSILPFLAVNRVTVGGVPIVAGYLAGGMLVHQGRFDDVSPALGDVPFPLPTDAVEDFFVQRQRDSIAPDQNRKHDRPFKPVDRFISKHRDESLLDTQFQHLHGNCWYFSYLSYDIWRRSARQNDTFDNTL